MRQRELRRAVADQEEEVRELCRWGADQEDELGGVKHHILYADLRSAVGCREHDEGAQPDTEAATDEPRHARKHCQC